MIEISRKESPNVQAIIPISLEKSIGLEEAQAYHEQIVQVRGFLYPLESGELILAHQPNLKSCCVGAQSLINQQILVQDKVSTSLSAIQLKGIFLLDPHYNAKHELTSLYTLKQVEVLSTGLSTFSIVSFLLLMIGIGIFFFKKMVKF